jgi:hypothetical protein
VPGAEISTQVYKKYKPEQKKGGWTIGKNDHEKEASKNLC